MASSLGVLTLDLVAKTGGFIGPLDQASRKSKKASSDISASFKNSMKRIDAWAAGIAIAAPAAAIAFTKMSLSSADAIGKVSKTAGVTTDTIQEMRHAASLSGIAFGDLDQGMQQFNKRVGELRAGTGALYTYLNKTNKALMGQVTSAKSTDEALDLVFKSMKDVANSSDRAAIAAAAFGRSGQRISIMVDDYEQLRKEARDLGLVIDGDLIKNAEIANDKMDTMSRIIKTQLTSAFIELAPTIIAVTQGITGATIAISSFFKAADREVKETPYIDKLKEELISLEAALKDAEEAGVKTFATMTSEGAFVNTIGSARAQIKILKEEIGSLSNVDAGDVGGEIGQEVVNKYKLAFSSLDKITPKIFNVLKSEYEKDRDEFIEITGDKLAAQEIFNQKMIALNKKLTGEDTSWADFGKVIEETSKVNKQRLELIKNSNAAIAAENDRQLKEDIARDAVLRQYIEEADIAEINNTKDNHKRELKLHEYKFAKLKELYEEDSEERQQIERIKTAELEKINNEFNESYWDNYLVSLENNMKNMDQIVGDSISNLSSQFGDFFASAIMDSENLEESFKNMALGIAKSMLSAIGEMIAQWLVYKITKIAANKAVHAAAIPEMVAAAEAGSLLAGINAYASAAAIPYVGWAMAPGAMAAAEAVTQPMVGGVTAAMLAGMAHDGIESVPETGTWLLQKGERVVAADTSQRLDNILSKISSGGSKTTIMVNLHGNFIGNNAAMRDLAIQIDKNIKHELSRRGAIV